MPRIYRYVVKHDSGAAPNVDGCICTCAVCKPAIRRSAKLGEWVVGLWPAPHRTRLTYAMRVGRKLSFADYWNLPEFEVKKPGRSATPDNIYAPDGKGGYQQVANITHDPAEATKDLNGQFVLVADRFWYFGGQPCELPKRFWRLDLPGSRHGHRVSEWSTMEINYFVDWLKKHGEGVLGSARDCRVAVDAVDSSPMPGRCGHASLTTKKRC